MQNQELKKKDINIKGCGGTSGKLEGKREGRRI
jgi:hypothetical protein